MKRRRWRLRALLALAAAAGSGLLWLAAWLIAAQALRHAVGPGDVGHTELARVFLPWALLLTAVSATGGWWLGRRLSRPLHELRRSLLAHPRSDPERPLLDSRFVEVQELADAAELGLVAADRSTAIIEGQRKALSSLVESAGEGLLRVDPGGHIGFANPAARALLGLPDAALGMVLPALVRNTELRLVVARALGGEQVNGQEIAFGQRRLLLSARPLREPRGAAGGAVIAIADLTALRHLEGVRRDFVANVSHELKTPLTSIRGYVETLLQEDLDPDARHEFLAVVFQNTERLQHLVDDLLDLSRIESGGWQPALQELGAADVVQEAWSACDDRARQRGVRFLPPTNDCRVLADRGALRQVLGNLFDNAIRYTPAGGTISVQLTPALRPGATTGAPDREAEWVHLQVSDTGTGIPHAALPRVFERFYRVDPARSRADGGTGLGLAIVKHLVESMGGQVRAESTLGQGSTMHVWLRSAR